MPATTISAILDRFETLLQTSPLSLEPSGDPFSDVGVPNSLTSTSFRLVSGGVVNDRPTSNWQTLRIDRVVVTLQRAIAFDGYLAQRELQDLLDDIERAVIADGPDHGYFVSIEKGSRKITRKKDSDVIEASLNFLCDYDFDESDT